MALVWRLERKSGFRFWGSGSDITDGGSANNIRLLRRSHIRREIEKRAAHMRTSF
jgi:hypothetical protein